MLNIIEVHNEINKLENCECTTQDVCKKLAILYIIRDHYKGDIEMDTKSSVSNMMSSPMGMGMVK